MQARETDYINNSCVSVLYILFSLDINMNGISVILSIMLLSGYGTMIQIECSRDGRHVVCLNEKVTVFFYLFLTLIT